MQAFQLLNLGGFRRTPVINQSEAAECGLACLAMVSGFHGLKTDLPTLRRRFNVSLKGMTLKTLIEVAHQVGFNARPLRGELEHLSQLPLPAILHWNMNHFVVLTAIGGGLRARRYHIHDPARGRSVLREGEFSRHFSGVMIELLPSEAFKPKTERKSLRITQLWSKVTGLRRNLVSILILSLVLQVVALATPFYLQVAIDTAIPALDSDLLLVLAVGFGGLMLINMLTVWLRTLIVVSLSSSLSYQVIVNLYRHLLKLPLGWFEKRHVGDIISRFGSTQPISHLLSQGIVTSIIDGLMAFATLAFMFTYSALLGGVAVVAWLLFVGLKLGFVHALRVRNIDVITTAAREDSSFIESIRGVSAIKSFGLEVNRQRIWQQLKADEMNAQIRLSRLNAGFEAGGQLILSIEQIVFVYLAIGMAMNGVLTVGMIFALQAYKHHFLGSATRLVEQAISYRLLDVHLHRIADIALATPEHDEAAWQTTTEGIKGKIELNSVAYTYGAGEHDILRRVNVKIEPGEIVAFTGPSGGGKTTLLKIMMGLFQPSYGDVFIDGRPLRSYGSSWRRQIGSVSQDDQLFAGTIGENIAFFDPMIDMDRVIEVARIACIHDEINGMPLRYETLVGDMGSVLSGGKKQRVLLARALYPNPSILFVDEGTAHLDEAGEARVMDALCDLGITCVISAHRRAPIERAHHVFIVNGGLIFETGAGTNSLNARMKAERV